MRTGIKLLLQSKGRSEEEIDRVVIAGAFGTYIDVSNAITVGMLPALPLERFTQVGNAAGTGARLALISRTKRQEAQAVARRIKYIELNTIPNFQEVFTDPTFRRSSPIRCIWDSLCGQMGMGQRLRNAHFTTEIRRAQRKDPRKALGGSTRAEPLV